MLISLPFPHFPPSLLLLRPYARQRALTSHSLSCCVLASSFPSFLSPPSLPPSLPPSCWSSATELGLELTFHGLSDKLLRLVELVLRRLLVREGGSEGGKEDPLFPSSCAGLSSSPQAVRFAAQKEALIRVYANGNMKPSRHARNLRLGVLKEKMWQCEELEREARSLTLEAVAAFAPRLLEALQVDGLYQVRGTEGSREGRKEGWREGRREGGDTGTRNDGHAFLP